jgi:GntR family transcriptional regulator of vanillate catabolism
MNVAFHETILEQSGNRWVVDLVRQTHNVPLASDRVFVWEDYQTIRRSHDDHHRILEAITARDASRAEALMREHIFFAGQVLRRAAEQTPNWWRSFPGKQRDATTPLAHDAGLDPLGSS